MKDIRTGYQTAISIQGMLLYLMSLSVAVAFVRVRVIIRSEKQSEKTKRKQRTVSAYCSAACDLMIIGLSDSHAYAYDSNF